MTTISTTAPQWNAAITGVTIQNGPTPTALKSTDYGSLAADIDAFVKTTAFQEALQSLSSTTGTLNIRVTIEGDKLTITNRTTGTDSELLSTTSLAPEKVAQFKATIDKVNTFAAARLGTAAPTPFISEEQSKALCTEYAVHGMENGCNYCYANSAYQLLSNVESLKTSVMDKLPDSVKKLKDYSDVKTGKEVLTLVNTLRTGQLSHTEQYDVTDALFPILGRVDTFPAKATFTTTQLRDPSGSRTDSDNKFDIDKEEPLSSIPLVTSNQTTTYINFNNALKDTFSIDQEARTSEGATITSTKVRFNKAPEHLFVRVDRLATPGKKDIRPIDAPEILNLASANGMKEGVTAELLYLKGFTVHIGNRPTGGHYIAYFQKQHPSDPNKSQWFMANDNVVKAVTEKEALQAAQQASDLYYDDTKPTVAAEPSAPASPSPLAAVPQRPLREPISSPLAQITECLEGSKKDDITFLIEKYDSNLFTDEERDEIAEAIGEALPATDDFLTALSNLAPDHLSRGRDFIKHLTPITPRANIFVDAFKHTLEKKKTAL